MEALEALLTRRSYARGNLAKPAPNNEELGLILQSAMTVPDHGKLKPWRFVVVRGEGIKNLSQLVYQHYQSSDMSTEQLDAFVKEIAETPMMIFVYSQVKINHRIPVIEQHLSGAAACEHILLAAHALGFAGIWHSLEANDDLQTLFNMSKDDIVLGLLSLGTPKRTAPAKRKPFEDYTSEWDGFGELKAWKVGG